MESIFGTALGSKLSVMIFDAVDNALGSIIEETLTWSLGS